MPEIHIIAAVASNGVIGSHGRVPWYIPADMEHFRSLTLGHTVLMGRRTFESIGHPLEGRRNVVLTSRPLEMDGVEVIHSPEEFERFDGKVFVIGGAQVYALFLPMAVEMHITHIHRDFDGDTFFPPVDWRQWHVTERRGPYHHGDIPYEFVRYRRV